MPYVDSITRARLDNMKVPANTIPVNPGELNYRITKLCIDYLELWGLSYLRINDVLGALEGAKAEFYRRVAVPYENEKIRTNGDVYPEKFTKF